MDVGELLFWFLVVPAFGYGLAAIWMRWTLRRIAERELGFLRQPGITARFLLFLTLPTTTILFGLVVFIVLLEAPSEPVSNGVVRFLGLTFGVAAVLTALSEAWLVVRRRATAYRKDTFSRVLVLAVIPETLILWALVIAIQIVGFVVRRPTEPPLSTVEAEALVRACQYTLVGSIGAPLAAFLANRVPTLEQKSFSRALRMATAGTVVMLVGFVLAIREITGL